MKKRVHLFAQISKIDESKRDVENIAVIIEVTVQWN